MDWHLSDAARELMAKAENHISRIDVFHNQILVAVYEGPEKSKGGVIYSDIRKRENEYQGKVGLVLKLGPLAFVDDERNKFHGQRVAPGEWIALRPGDGWPMKLGGIDGLPCRVLEDVHVKMRLDNPDEVY